MSEHRLSCALCGREEPKTGPFLRLVRLEDGRWICWDCRAPKEIETPEDVRVGMWYAICCMLDLSEIDSEEELNYVRDMMLEPYMVHVYATREAAIADLSDVGVDAGD